MEEYLKKYAWPETDVTILGDGLGHVHCQRERTNDRDFEGHEGKTIPCPDWCT